LKNNSLAFYRVDKTKGGQVFNTKFMLTDHCLARMRQRGITMEMVEFALQYGLEIWAQGSLYYFVGKRHAKRFGKMAEKLEGLVVVIESRSRCIVTVFKNRRWTKKVRHKA